MNGNKHQESVEIALVVAGFLIVVALGNPWVMIYGSLIALVWLFVVRRNRNRRGLLEPRNFLAATICAAVVSALTVFLIKLV